MNLQEFIDMADEGEGQVMDYKTFIKNFTSTDWLIQSISKSKFIVRISLMYVQESVRFFLCLHDFDNTCTCICPYSSVREQKER